MLVRILAAVAAASTTVFACPDHDNYELGSRLRKRAERHQDWAYEASYNWGMVNENYTLCQTGTQQSPIPLLITQGLSLVHVPTFNYPDLVDGNFYNWGYGPAFTLAHPAGNFTGLPQVRFDNETLYLISWHVHAPADHTVQGDRSKAELHMVHADANGRIRAVFAIRIDPGNANSHFFGQLPPMVRFNETEVQLPLSINPNLALNEVNRFSEFWTYRGSLTSPPCMEGVRWWVARNILFTSNEQMQNILRASTYSARAEQEVWLHQING